MNIKFNIGAIKVLGEMVTAERHGKFRNDDTSYSVEKETAPINVELKDLGFEVEEINMMELGKLIGEIADMAKELGIGETRIKEKGQQEREAYELQRGQEFQQRREVLRMERNERYRRYQEEMDAFYQAKEEEQATNSIVTFEDESSNDIATFEDAKVAN